MRRRWYHKAAHLADMTDCGRCLSFHSDTIFAEALSVGTGRPFDIYLTSKCLLSCSLLYLLLCPCAQNVTSCYTMTDTAPILSLLIFILVDGFFFFFFALVVVTWTNQLYIKAQSHFQFVPLPLVFRVLPFPSEQSRKRSRLKSPIMKWESPRRDAEMAGT